MDSATDTPNPGRMYDWLLGGNHNFQADRDAGEKLLQLIPSARNAARLNRWFLHDAIDRLASSRFAGYLDLASGLPTEGYIHERVARQTPILYNDRDPVTVEYGRTLVAEYPNVVYIQADIGDIDQILAAADAHFGGERRVGIFFVGVTYFLDDSTLATALRKIHAWCAPGSRMALSWVEFDEQQPEYAATSQMYSRLNSAVYSRQPSAIERFLSGWQIEAPGICPLGDWLDTEDWHVHRTELFEIVGTIVTKL